MPDGRCPIGWLVVRLVAASRTQLAARHRAAPHPVWSCGCGLTPQRKRGITVSAHPPECREILLARLPRLRRLALFFGIASCPAIGTRLGLLRQTSQCRCNLLGTPFFFFITHVLFHSRLKTFFFLQILPSAAFLFFRTDYMIPQTFTVTSKF